MRLSYFLYCLFGMFIYGNMSHAQDVCNDPAFEKGNFNLSSNDICHSDALTITGNNNIANALYFFNYQGESYTEVRAGSVPNNDLDFTNLKSTGVYTIVQTGEIAGKPSVACKDVKIRVNNQPVFSYFLCDSDMNISIPDLPVNDYKEYEITLNGVSTNIAAKPGGVKIALPANPSYSMLKVKGIGGNTTCPGEPENKIVRFDPNGIDMDFAPAIPKIQITDDNKIKLDLVGEYDEKYDIYRFDYSNISIINALSSAFSVKVGTETLKPGSTFYDSPAGADQNSYCYFLEKANSNCGSTSIMSAENCTVPLSLIDVSKHTENKLSWKSITQNNPFLSRPIEKSTSIQKIEDDSFMPSPNISGSTYTDPIDCSKPYCYRIKIASSGILSSLRYTKFAYESYSNQICVDRVAGPFSPMDDFYVTTEPNLSNKIKFTDQNESSYPLKEWELFRQENSGFESIGLLENGSNISYEIVDNDVVPVEKSETYKLKYKDVCGNESELSDEVSSIFLDFNNNILIWSEESPFVDQSTLTSYEILYHNPETGADLPPRSEKAGVYRHLIDPSGFINDGLFRVKAVSDNGRESFSNPVRVPVKGNLFIPDVFSPNGDSHNEVFAVKGALTGVDDFKMEIFTPTGIKVIELNDINSGWNGILPDGQKASQGTYVYKMAATMHNGHVIRKIGNFRILY